MKFHNYYPLSQGMSFGVQTAYDRLAKSFTEENKLAHASITQLEGLWCETKKPYYRVPPTVLPKLLAFDLSNTSCLRVSLHHPCMSINFAEGHELHGCHSILAGKDIIKTHSVLTFATQGDWQGAKLCCIPFKTEHILTDVFEKVTDVAAKIAGYNSRGEVCDIIQVIAAISQFVCQPEVLAKDQGKPYSHDLWQKAMNRGKFGWSVTEILNVS